MHWRLTRAFLVVFVVFALLTAFGDATIAAQTLSPFKVLGRYQQSVWQDQHGLPQNSVQALTRTRDGYLWMGTVEGAVRFTVFDTATTPAIHANEVEALLEDRRGHL